jgi:hypothetical protein
MNNICSRLIGISSMSTALWMYAGARNRETPSHAAVDAVRGGVMGAFTGYMCFAAITHERKNSLRFYAAVNIFAVAAIECVWAAFELAVKHKQLRDATKNDRPEGWVRTSDPWIRSPIFCH